MTSVGAEIRPSEDRWSIAAIASAIPGARLRVIRGAAHLANVSSAAEFSATLLAHLAAWPGPDQGHGRRHRTRDRAADSIAD